MQNPRLVAVGSSLSREKSVPLSRGVTIFRPREVRSSQCVRLPMWPLAPMVIVQTVTELVADKVAEGKIAELPELEDDLIFLIVLVIADAAPARRATVRRRE